MSRTSRPARSIDFAGRCLGQRCDVGLLLILNIFLIEFVIRLGRAESFGIEFVIGCGFRSERQVVRQRQSFGILIFRQGQAVVEVRLQRQPGVILIGNRKTLCGHRHFADPDSECFLTGANRIVL